jgi:hypothetical protein
MFTPSYLRLLQGAVPAGLRCLLTAGERPNAADARAYARKLEYWNIQGATEVCGTICMSRVDPNGAWPARQRPAVHQHGRLSARCRTAMKSRRERRARSMWWAWAWRAAI